MWIRRQIEHLQNAEGLRGVVRPVQSFPDHHQESMNDFLENPLNDTSEVTLPRCVRRTAAGAGGLYTMEPPPPVVAGPSGGSSATVSRTSTFGSVRSSTPSDIPPSTSPVRGLSHQLLGESHTQDEDQHHSLPGTPTQDESSLSHLFTQSVTDSELRTQSLDGIPETSQLDTQPIGKNGRPVYRGINHDM